MLSNKQKDFLLNPLSRINLLYGAVRSGKTWISLLKWAVWIGQQPIKDEFLMVGKTVTALKRNCLGLLQELIGDNITYSISQKKAVIFGRTVWLEGANDERAESKIRGMTLKGCYIDELTQIPESFYLMVLSRLSVKNSSLIATTNPDAPTHYVKTEIIDNDKIKKQVVKFTIDDNIFLDEESKKNIIAEYSTSKVYYSRFILGDFVRAEGVVFFDFAENTEKYIINKNDLPKFRTVGVGYDLGGNKSNFALVCTAIGFDDKVYVLRAEEIEPENMKLSDVENYAIKFIQKVEKDFNCEVNYCYIDDNYWTTVNSLNDWRYIFGSAATIKCSMPLEDRPICLSKLMATERFYLVDGECEPLIKQLQNAVYDDRAEKAVILDDGSMNIDEIDGLFYSIADDYLYLFD